MSFSVVGPPFQARTLQSRRPNSATVAAPRISAASTSTELFAPASTGRGGPVTDLRNLSFQREVDLL